MSIDSDDEEDMQYQMTTKMFYHVAMHAVLGQSLQEKKPLTSFGKRMALAYVTLCRATGSWHEDEQYKRDPRWKLDL